MNTDEFEDRYRALEMLTVHLIRHLSLTDAIPRERVQSLMDSLEDMATGDERMELATERLRHLVEGQNPDEEQRDSDSARMKQKRESLYGASYPLDG